MEFGYWGIQGLGQSIRYLLITADAKYTEKSYSDFNEWFGKDKPELFKQTPFANLPYLKDGDKVMTQSGCILRYLGHKLDFCPEKNDVQGKINCEVVYGVLTDLWAKWVKLIFDKANYEANKEAAHTQILALFTQVNNHLNTHKFVAGEKLTWCDFFLFTLLTVFTKYSKKIAALSNLAQYMENFNSAAGPKLVSYVAAIKGTQPILPPGLTALDGATLEDLKCEF